MKLWKAIRTLSRGEPEPPDLSWHWEVTYSDAFRQTTSVVWRVYNRGYQIEALSIDNALETGLDTLRLRLVPSGVVYKLADTDVVTLPAELGYLIERGWLIEVST